MTAETLTFDAFAARYCERQEQTPAGILAVLHEQRERFANEGWVLLECQMFDSSRFGHLTILPYGPHNTLHAVPTQPLSPRGLASDMSIVIAVLPAEALPPLPAKRRR